MAEKTPFANLYKWDKKDKKQETIDGMFANSELIDAKLSEHDGRLSNTEDSLTSVNAELASITPKIEEAVTATESTNNAATYANQSVLNISESVSEAVTIANEELQTQLDNIVIASGTSDAETIQARGTFPVLNDRLEDVTSQLAQTQKKTLFLATPEMFGAVADGLADDTQAINDAVQGGGIVFFHPNKTYKISNPILVDKERILNFSNSTILCDASFVGDKAIYVTVSNVIINNLVVDGNNKAVTGIYTYLDGTLIERINFSNVKTINCGIKGILCKDVKFGNLSEILMDNCGYNDDFGGVLRIITSSDMKLEHITIDNCCGRGLTFESGSDNILDGFLITNLKDNSQLQTWESLYLNSPTNLKISNGTIKNCNGDINNVKFSRFADNVEVNNVEFYYDESIDNGSLLRIQGPKNIFFNDCRFYMKTSNATDNLIRIMHHSDVGEGAVCENINFNDSKFLGSNDGINYKAIAVDVIGTAVEGHTNNYPEKINFFDCYFENLEKGIVNINAVGSKVIDCKFFNIRAICVSMPKTDGLAQDCIIKGNTMKSGLDGQTVQGVNIDGHTNTVFNANIVNMFDGALSMKNATGCKITHNDLYNFSTGSLSVASLGATGNTVTFNTIQGGDDINTTNNTDQNNVRIA